MVRAKKALNLLNIALISHPTYPIPPYDGYGGVQRGIYDLSIGLANKGHCVYLFCAKTSKIGYPNVHKISIAEHGFAELHPDSLPSDIKLLEADVLRRISIELDLLIAQNKIDIINLRWEDIAVQAMCKSKNIPLLMSVHCQIPQAYAEQFFDDDLPYTFHTQTHKDDHVACATGVVNEYAISMNHIPVSYKTLSECPILTEDMPSYLRNLWEEKQDYMVYISGIRKQKSQASAIHIAKQAAIPIVLAGSPSSRREDNVDWQYYKQIIEPEIDGESVIYVPNVNETEKYNLLKYAKGFIFAAGQEDDSWVEPYGRVISESLATGTPVIGYKHGGSVTEQVINGKNGYLYNTIDEAVSYTQLLTKLSRKITATDARERLGINKFLTATEDTLYTTIATFAQTDELVTA